MHTTTIKLVDGSGHAEVITATPDGTPVVQKITVNTLIDALARGIVEEGGVANTAGERRATTARIIDPLAWRINLFPDMPYAVFEAASGDLTIVVRGYEPQTKNLLWRPSTARDQKTESLAFKLPRILWLTAWKKKKMIKAWVFTCEAFPTNVVDEAVQIRPWAAGNVFERGEVCWGSTALQAFGADGVNLVASSFFGSIFNDHIPRIRLKEKFLVEGAYAHGFSLKGLHAQTTEGQVEKIGSILPDPGNTTTLKRAIQAAAAE